MWMNVQISTTEVAAIFAPIVWAALSVLVEMGTSRDQVVPAWMLMSVSLWNRVSKGAPMRLEDFCVTVLMDTASRPMGSPATVCMH